MRTESFRSVMHRAIRRRGLDPAQGVQSATFLAIGEYIDQYARRAWRWTDWPELTTYVEALLRPAWNVATAYTIGQQVTYENAVWQATANHTGSTPFADAEDWIAIAVNDLTLASVGVESGAVLDVWDSNPQTADDAKQVGWIDRGTAIYIKKSAAKVWLYISVPVSRFSAAPWAVGTAYNAGDVVYLESTGECYKATASTTGDNPATATSIWTLQRLPLVLADYAAIRTAADLYREDEQMDKAMMLDGLADDCLLEQQDQFRARTTAAQQTGIRYSR